MISNFTGQRLIYEDRWKSSPEVEALESTELQWMIDTSNFSDGIGLKCLHSVNTNTRQKIQKLLIFNEIVHG